MAYPFKFQIGDRVAVNGDVEVIGGRKGEIHALELSARKNVAVVKCHSSQRGDYMFRVCESQLHRA